jgi:cyclic pyranopterin phosphate synthase
MPASKLLIDGLGRRITYLRVSVTDRCDLRCTYCMPERTAFAPKGNLLDFEELDRLCALFVGRGVRKLRITGGEPLIRRGVIDFIGGLSRHLRSGALDELTLTTNGTQLAQNADALARAGVKRINVSLDTLDRDTFKRISRRDRLLQVLEGIAEARAAGLSVKINTVALRRDNAVELPEIIRWAHANSMDLTLIETMPVGEIEEDRTDQFMPLTQVRRELERVWTLEDEARTTGGPARYARVRETGGRIGFITPITNVFCATCNRVRLTCSGQLFLCLGRDDKIDFREALRSGCTDADLEAMLNDGISQKPAAHDFRITARGTPAVERHMSVTGG